MKYGNSLKSASKRHRANKVCVRYGTTVIINKEKPSCTFKQGLKKRKHAKIRACHLFTDPSKSRKDKVLAE